MEPKAKGHISNTQTQHQERRCATDLSQRRGLGARGLGAGRHHGGDLRLELGDLVLVKKERLCRPEADLLDQKPGLAHNRTLALVILENRFRRDPLVPSYLNAVSGQTPSLERRE